MKIIETHKEVMDYLEGSCGKCKIKIDKDRYEVTCKKCIKSKKKDLVDEIDADGNGHITHKEVEDYSKKDK